MPILLWEIKNVNWLIEFFKKLNYISESYLVSSYWYLINHFSITRDIQFQAGNEGNSHWIVLISLSHDMPPMLHMMNVCGDKSFFNPFNFNIFSSSTHTGQSWLGNFSFCPTIIMNVWSTYAFLNSFWWLNSICLASVL